MQPHTQNIHINNVHVHYEYYQSRSETQPTLILIHGFLSSTFSFRKLIPILQEDFNLLALDLPPFGKSEKSTKFKYSFQNFSDIVVKLIHTLQIKKPILLGHSMGGQVALKAAKEYPELFSGIILLSSSSYLKKSRPHLIYCSYLPFFSFGIRKWLEVKGVKENLLACVSDQAMIDDEMILGYGEPFGDSAIFRSLTRMIRDRESDLSSEQLEAIKTPTLLIWGEEDQVVPVRVGKKLASDLSESTLLIYKKTGHLLPEEAPERVRRDIITFLSGKKEYSVSPYSS